MNRLRIVREKKDKTLEQVAQAMKSTRGTIQRFETGQRNVTLSWLERLADFYGVNIAELVTDEFESQIDTVLLEEVIGYALDRCQAEKVDGKTLAKVIAITYARCQQKKDEAKTEQIREKVDDMLACVV
ncbi:MAG: helix-turn-helix domain-containing protein [Bdellovibrionales bacterium]